MSELKLNPTMNAHIVGLLRSFPLEADNDEGETNLVDWYAAARIEELEAQAAKADELARQARAFMQGIAPQMLAADNATALGWAMLSSQMYSALEEYEEARK